MYANDYKDIGALKELADKYGICILLVHHLRKQSSSDPYDQISGSTGIMGVADTTWFMHRQRMSKTATVRVIGRDMDEKMLHIREENCVWTLDEEETAEQQALKAIPDYLWKVADYIDSVGKWQGTATELLVAANISDVKPNQFTRKMAHYARDIFSLAVSSISTPARSKNVCLSSSMTMMTVMTMILIYRSCSTGVSHKHRHHRQHRH